MFWLHKQLKNLRKASAPTNAFRAELWTELSATYDAAHPRTRHTWTWRFATAGMAAFVVVFMTGTGVYAYESPDVTPEHPLFQVRLGMEDVEGRLQRTPEQRERFRNKIQRRRQKEAERMIRQHQNDPVPTNQTQETF